MPKIKDADHSIKKLEVQNLSYSLKAKFSLSLDGRGPG